MMMMTNCFCGMVDGRKVFILISRQDHCPRFSPPQIMDTSQAGLEPMENLKSVLVESGCVVVITATPHHYA